MKKLLFVLTVFLILTIGCIQSSEPDRPDWVDNLIEEFKSQSVGNPPQSIWRYSYKDQNVYYVPAQCCDQFSKLYDENGNIICAPDGGFAGGGDGKCPDFFTERKNEKLIWKDPPQTVNRKLIVKTQCEFVETPYPDKLCRLYGKDKNILEVY